MFEAYDFTLLSWGSVLTEIWDFYWLSLVVAIGGLLYVGLRKPRAHAAASRNSSDSIHFTSVFVWAYQCAHLAVDSFSWHGFTPDFPEARWRARYLILAAIALAMLLTSGFLAEAIARHRGLAVRTGSAAIPLPVVAAMGSGLLMWFFALTLLI